MFFRGSLAFASCVDLFASTGGTISVSWCYDLFVVVLIPFYFFLRIIYFCLVMLSCRPWL